MACRRAPWGVILAFAYATVGDHLNPYLTVTGLLIGFLVGLTGMGGGALMTPILIFVFGFKPTLAIGTDITYGAITKSLRLLAALAPRLGGHASHALARARERAGHDLRRRPHRIC